jgi:hypothetical protein
MATQDNEEREATATLKALLAALNTLRSSYELGK